jgi:uncharacterized protein involved in exopolysaccharide biosynthesis
MSPDLPQPAAAEGHRADAQPPATPPAASAGLLEFALPLWHRRWWLLLGTLLCGTAGFGASLYVPLKFTAQVSFVVQPLLRPSSSVVASGLPALAGLVGSGTNPLDLHVAILRSQSVADRIIDRFDLQRLWKLRFRAQTQAKLAKRVGVGVGRRDGVVQVVVDDESPQRAAAMANEYVEELRSTLRGFALEEARQRRLFYDTQLARAREALARAQGELQASGFDRAALRAEPRAAAEAYARMQAEIAASEVRLAATRRVRAEGSAEVQQQRAELAVLRGQLARLEVPRDESQGGFVSKVRDYRYAESLADSIARQAEAARVDEASDPVPLQLLDRAKVPEWPSSPHPPSWATVGAALGLLLGGAWVLLRHRLVLLRLDPAHRERVAFLHTTLPRRRR